MKAKLWHLVAIAASIVLGVCLAQLKPLTMPRPPDFSGQNFTSVRVILSQEIIEAPEVSLASEDPLLITKLTEIVGTGRSVGVCRCAALGHMEFLRADGTSEKLLLMPAHNESSVEFRVMGLGRFRVDRDAFLRVVQPLGIPANRWYDWPQPEIDAVPLPAESS